MKHRFWPVSVKILLALAVTVLVLDVVVGGFLLFTGYFELPDIPQLSLTKENIPKAYVVQSGSMEPAVKLGSVAFARRSSSYVPGDVITFSPTGSKRNLVTHRIMVKNFPEGIENEPTYLTAGDANEDFDRSEITQDKIVGKVFLTIPYLGYVVNFAKQPQGFILLVIIPATIIIYEELKNVRRELGRVLGGFFTKFAKKFRKKEEDTAINLVPAQTDGGLPKVAVVIPLIGAALVFIAVSGAYFLDNELSIDNILGAATEFATPSPSPSPSPTPPPIAQTLVINEVLPDSSCVQGNTEAQWIEVYNGFNFAVNPKNYKITDGTNTVDLVTANNLTIAPGGFLLLAHNAAIWGVSGCYSDNGTQTGNLGGQLNIDVGELRLIDADGVTVLDVVRWNQAGDATPSQNQSIEREPDGLDTAPGASFNPSDFVVRTTPMPGL